MKEVRLLGNALCFTSVFLTLGRRGWITDRIYLPGFVGDDTWMKWMILGLHSYPSGTQGYCEWGEFITQCTTFLRRGDCWCPRFGRIWCWCCCRHCELRFMGSNCGRNCLFGTLAISYYVAFLLCRFWWAMYEFAGWSDHSLLRCGRFYPASVRSAEDRLQHYSRHFPCWHISFNTCIPPPVIVGVPLSVEWIGWFRIDSFLCIGSIWSFKYLSETCEECSQQF